MQAKKIRGFDQSIIYKPSSAVAEGDVLVLEGMVVIATRDCPADFYGEFETAGIFDFPQHVGTTFAIGHGGYATPFRTFSQY